MAGYLSRAVLVCVGLLSATIAIAELGNSIELSSVSVLADRLRTGDPISLPVLSRGTSDFGADSVTMSCRSDAVADVLTVHLHYLDRLDETENYEEWASGIADASAFVEDALGCFPADGNLWSRLAMMRQASVSLPAETAELMRRSVELSPAQINVILARFEVWRRMDVADLKLADVGLRTDLRNLLAFGKASDLQRLQSKLNIALSELAYAETKSIPKTRDAHINLLKLNYILPEIK